MTYILTIMLLALSALFSGLTLGTMGSNPQELKRKAESGDALAKRVYSVRKHGNLLLTTLLLGNVVVNSILAVFLGSIMNGAIAVAIVTGLIVIFGEILPQALFNRHAVVFSAKFVWFLKLCMAVLYPVAKPIAMALDYMLGDELPTVYSKRELIKLIEEHEDAHDSEVDADEERIIKGALSFSDKKVRDIMTPRSVVHAFDTSDPLNDATLAEIRNSGVSRFPVFNNDTDTVVGILYLATLVGAHTAGKTAGDMMEKDVRTVRDTEPLDTALQHFLRSHKHLAIVEDEFGSMVGVVTLEDVLEEILKTEIIDERDEHADLRAVARAQKRRKRGV